MKPQNSSLTAMRRRAVDRLLVQYLELPRTQQAGYLATCQNRYPRLSLWLDQLVDTGHTVTLLDDSVRHLAGAAVESQAADESSTRLAPNTRIGPWRILGDAGQGGMGLVYRGERADGAFEMEVAIKIISRRKRGLAELLQRECRLLAKLDHPSITRLVDAGLDDSAGPFLVMEWVEGTNLDEWIAANSPSLEQRLQLFDQVAEATTHAHQRLIVHGDIKPGNIRIRADGQVKLMDFGVARLLQANDAGAADIRALTPSFAAPEQLQGEEITPKSDIWSLGAMLYWLLTGEVVDKASLETIRAQLALRYRRGAELAAIVTRACCPNPDDRYQSASEVAAEIGRYRHHFPLVAMPATAHYRTAMLLRRNPVLVGGVLASFLVLAGGLVATSWMYLMAEQARQEAAMQQATAEARAVELEQVATFQEGQLGQIDPQLMGARLRASMMERRRGALQAAGADASDINQAVRTLEASLAGINFTDIALRSLDENIFATTLEAIDDQFGEQPLIRARLLQSVAATLQELGRTDQAEQPQTEALAIRRELLGPTHQKTLESKQALGALYWRQTRYKEAGELIEHTLRKREHILGPDHPDTLVSYHALGTLSSTAGDHDRAETYLLKAVEGRQAVLGSGHIETLRSTANLGLMYSNIGNFDQADHYLRQSLAGKRKLLGEYHPLTLISLTNFGVLEERRGNHEQAAEYHEQAYDVRKSLHGEFHPHTLRSLSNLAFALQQLGEFDAAETYHRQSLEGRIRVMGELHSDTWVSLLNLGDLLRQKKNFEEAEGYLQRALQVGQQVFGPYHLRTLVSANNLSRLMLDRGETEKAEQMAEVIASDALEHLGENNMYSGIILQNHARTLKSLGHLERASHQAGRAYEIYIGTIGGQHDRTLETADLLAQVYLQLSDRSDNPALLEKSAHWRQLSQPDG